MNLLLRDGKPISRDAVFRDERDENEIRADDDGYCSSLDLSASSGIGDRGTDDGRNRNRNRNRNRSSDGNKSTSTSDHHNKTVRGTEETLRKAFARLPEFEEIHVIDNDSKEAAVDKNDGEQELEFRLFATSSSSSLLPCFTTGPTDKHSNADTVPINSKDTTTTTTQRIRLNSPSPCQNPGFVVPNRQLEYYLAVTPSAAKMAEYESAAVEGEDVMKAAGTVWYGCTYEWKIIRVRSRGDDGGGDGALINRSVRPVKARDVIAAAEEERVDGECNQITIGTEKGEGGDKGPIGIFTGPDGKIAGDERGKSRKRKTKPGKKARIRIRMLVRAQEQKEVQMQEKKVRKNQRRKVKRKEKVKRLKELKNGVDAEVRLE